MPDHTTWRVFCRALPPCDGSPWPRLERKKANATAEEHNTVTGHAVDVVKVQFTIVRRFPVTQNRCVGCGDIDCGGVCVH
jgi:hypothetical protein